MTTVRLDSDSVEAIASRVAELLANRAANPAGPGLVDAAALARELGTSRAYIYEHAEQLGGIRLGSGSRPRLRFDVAQAKAAHQAKPASPPVPDTSAPRRRKPGAAQPSVLRSRPRAQGRDAA